MYIGSYAVRNKGLLGRVFGVLTLFVSTGTLICCALPAAIAAILGTTVLFSIIDTIPFIVTLSEHKGWIFIAAGVLIAINIYQLWFSKYADYCPIDKKDECKDGKKFAKVITVLSAVIVAIGAYTAF